jgi:hypothetical protein
MLKPSVTLSPVGLLQNSWAQAPFEKINGETPVATMPAKPPLSSVRRLGLLKLVISSSFSAGPVLCRSHRRDAIIGGRVTSFNIALKSLQNSVNTCSVFE